MPIKAICQGNSINSYPPIFKKKLCTRGLLFIGKYGIPMPTLLNGPYTQQLPQQFEGKNCFTLKLFFWRHLRCKILSGLAKFWQPCPDFFRAKVTSKFHVFESWDILSKFFEPFRRCLDALQKKFKVKHFFSKSYMRQQEQECCFGANLGNMWIKR